MKIRHIINITVSVLALLLLNTISLAQPPPPSEEFIQKQFLYNHVNRLLTGPQVVTSGKNNFDKHEISQAEFKEVTAWAKAGLIELSSENSRSKDNGFSGWGDFFNQTQLGHMKKIVVTPTDAGRTQDQLAPTKNRVPGFTYALLYTQQLTKIISADMKSQAASQYCVVNALVSIDDTEYGKMVYKYWEGKNNPDGQHKCIMLLKYDPFEEHWVRIATDWALKGQQFKTHNVNTALLQGK